MKKQIKTPTNKAQSSEEFLGSLLNLISQSGFPDKKDQLLMLVQMIVHDSQLMQTLEERNPTLAKQLVDIARALGVLKEATS